MLMKYVYTMLLVCAAYMGQSQVLISILLGDKLNSGKIEFGLEGGWSMSTLQGVDPAKGHSNVVFKHRCARQIHHGSRRDRRILLE